MKLSKVIPGSFDLRTAGVKSGRDLFTGLSGVIGTVVTGVISHKLLNKIFSDEENTNANPTAAAIAVTIVAAMTATLKDIIFNWAKVRLSPGEAMKMTYLNHAALTKNALDRRPEDIRIAVAKLDDAVATLLKLSEPGDSIESTIREYYDARCFLMKLPTDKFTTPGSRTYFAAEERSIYGSRLSKLVERFPESVREQLKTYVFDLSTNQSTPALLLGEGGTGKTYFARLVAEFLGVPLLKMQPKSQGFVIAPDPDIYYYEHSWKAPPIHGDTIGYLAPMLANESGVLNPVLLLDEATFSPVEMTSLKLAIQDGSLAPFTLKPYNIRIDPSQVRIMIASNSKPSDGAFASRLRVFHIPPVSELLKMEHGIERVTDHAQKYVDDFVADEKLVNMARDLVISVVPRVIAGDKSPGVREAARNLAELFAFVVSELVDKIPVEIDVGKEQVLRSIETELHKKIAQMEEDAKATEAMIIKEKNVMQRSYTSHALPLLVVSPEQPLLTPAES